MFMKVYFHSKAFEVLIKVGCFIDWRSMFKDLKLFLKAFIEVNTKESCNDLRCGVIFNGSDF